MMAKKRRRRPPRRPTGQPLTVAFWNGGQRRQGAVEEGLARIFGRGAQVVGYAEGGRRGPLWAKLQRMGFRVVTGRLPGAPSVPTIVAPETRVWSWRARSAVKPRPVGAGAGPSRAKWKWFTAGRYGPDGIPHINGHFIASGTRRGPAYAARRAHHIAMMAVLVGMVEYRIRRHGCVVVTVDANAQPGHWLMAPLRRRGLVQVVDQRTHRNGIIDQIWIYGLELVDVDVIQMPGDDHDAPIATVRRAA